MTTTNKPFRIGIIGAENSHAAAIAKEINIARAFPGFAVTHIWGETEAFASKAAEAGAIPTIVREQDEMLGKIDGLMVDHRDGQYHVAAARPFVEAGIPVFVDKPLSTSLSEAREFLKFRREKDVPVTTASAVPLQSCIAGIRKQLNGIGKIRTIHLNGPGSSSGPYGGIFFYGIHQVDLMVALLGTGARTVTVSDDGDTFVGVVRYAEGVCASIGLGGANGFSITGIGTDGSFHAPIPFDANIYACTTGLFIEMFKTRVEPYDDARMLAPIAVLEALREAKGNGGRSVDVPTVEQFH